MPIKSRFEEVLAADETPRERLASLVVLMLVAAGVALVALGLSTEPAIQIEWLPEGARAASIAASVAIAIGAFAYWRRWPLVPISFGVVFVVSAAGAGVAAAATATVLLAAALHAGFAIAGEGRERHIAVQAPLAAAAGLALFAGVLQLGSRLPVHYPLVYLLLLGSVFLVRNTQTLAGWQRLHAACRRPGAAVDGLSLALCLLAAAGLAIRLVGALAPEAGTDALAMHLVMPAIVARDHGWWPAQNDFVWSWMPMAVNWVYALAYPLGGEAAARLVSFAADVLTVVLVAGLASELAGRRAGALAAAVLSTLPISYLMTTSLFVENLWSLWVLAALGIMQAIPRSGAAPARGMIALGLLLGAALAAKLMTVFWGPLVLWFMWWRRRDLDKRAAAALIIATVTVGSWPYMTAWIETGNPVFPFFNDVFRSPLIPAAAPFASPYNAGADLTTLFDVTFHTDRYLEANPGAFGFAFLTLLPAALVASLVRGGAWLRGIAVASVFVAMVCFHFTAYLRYIAPVFPVWALLIGVGLQRALSPRTQMVPALVMLAAGAAGLALFANSTWWYRSLPPAGPLDRNAYRAFETAMRPEARVVRQINELGLRHVLWVGRAHYAGLNARVTTSTWHQQSGWSNVKNLQELQAFVSQNRFDGLVLGPDVNLGSTVLGKASEALGAPAYVSGPVRLYRLVPGQLKGVGAKTGSQFKKELVKDPDLTEGSTWWGGSGSWNKTQGVMTVTADKTFAQGVSVTGGRAYQYRIRVRCVAGSGNVRAQVNWLGKDGAIIEPAIELVPCTTDFSDAIMDLEAPLEAAAAMVYAAAHDPAVVAEVDAVSLRE